MNKFDPKIHHRHSIRLKGYDYTQAGAYFVTICTWKHECLFGEVVEGEMRLSALGQIVRAEWVKSSDIRKEIRLFEDEFVIMPNHVHGIVWIAPLHDTGRGGNERAHEVGADGIRPGTVNPGDGGGKSQTRDGGQTQSVSRNQGASLAPLQRAERSLSSFVAGFKAVVTSRAGRELNMTSIWQRNYYEHIIRDEEDLRRIEEYIQSNPQRWEQDQLHPEAPPNQYNRV